MSQPKFRRTKIVTLGTFIIFILIIPLAVSLLLNGQNSAQAAGTYFSTLPPGSSLPSDADCAARVRRSSWEPRPDNTAANNFNVYAQGGRLTGSYLDQYGYESRVTGNFTGTQARPLVRNIFQSYESRVTGNFTGTTDEIIQWASCKWGFDENTVRAQAVAESYWHQSQLGDCGNNTQPETHGCASVGILQVKGADIPPTHPGTWPYAYQSTAFNIDYTLAVRRACFEGKETWLGDTNPSYAAGDEWGCIGRWYSGRWYDPGAVNYIASVKNYLQEQTRNTFGAGPAPTAPSQSPTPTNTPVPSSTSTSTSTPTPGTIIAQDTFHRLNQTHWGTASDGHTWGGDANRVSAFSIVNNTGRVSNSTTSYSAILGPVAKNAEVVFTGSMSSYSDNNLGAVLRWTNGNNWYKAYITGASLVVQKRVNGATTILKSVSFTATRGTSYTLRFRVVGTTLYARAWQTGTTEPTNWLIMVTDTSFSSGFCGLRMQVASGVTASYTSFLATAE